MREKQEEEDRHRATRRRLRLSRDAVDRPRPAAGRDRLSRLVGRTAAAKGGRAEPALLARYGETLRTDPAASLEFALRGLGRATDSRGSRRPFGTALDADTERVRVQADNGPLSTSELSPDGRMLLTAGKDGIAKLFDAATGRLLLSFEPAESVSRSGAQGCIVFSRRKPGSDSDDGQGRFGSTTRPRGPTLDCCPTRSTYAQAVWGRVGGRLVVLISDWNKPPSYGTRNAGLSWRLTALSASRDAAFSSDGRSRRESIESADASRAGSAFRTRIRPAFCNVQRSSAPPPSRRASLERIRRQIVLLAMEKDPHGWHLTLWDWRRGSSALRTLSRESQKPGGHRGQQGRAAHSGALGQQCAGLRR